MYKLIVFDMAGTVVDEDNLVYKTIHQMLEKASFNFSLEEVLRVAAGKEKKQAITDLLKTRPEVIDPERTAHLVFEDFRKALFEAYQTMPMQPQHGTEDVFRQLKERGVYVVLNTGYERKVVDLILQRLNWTNHPHIDAIICADDVEEGRPAPAMILQAMEKVGISEAASVGKIGDSIIDIEEGRNAHCGLVAGVTTGAHTQEQLASAQPTHIFNELEELLAVV